MPYVVARLRFLCIVACGTRMFLFLRLVLACGLPLVVVHTAKLRRYEAVPTI